MQKSRQRFVLINARISEKRKGKKEKKAAPTQAATVSYTHLTLPTNREV